MTTTRRKRFAISRRKFDLNGVRKATIAALSSAYQSGRFHSLPAILVAMAVIDAELDGNTHSMHSLSDTLGIPYTSVSRIVFDLTAEGGDGEGILTLTLDPEDRRCKIIGIDPAAYKIFGKDARLAAEQALIDYYGTSVRSLKPKKRA